MRIAIIGAGVMGATFARRFLQNRLIAPEDLFLVDVDEDKLHALSAELQCRVSTSFSAVHDADVVLFSIKPQHFDDVASQFRSFSSRIEDKVMVISVMAGITCQTITEKVCCHKIVRCMPNTPAKIGWGVISWYAVNLTATEECNVTKLLQVAGSVLRVEREDLIDVVTAISGSGPGYVFYFMENMIAEAVALGFSEENARLLTVQTFLGSSELARVSDESLDVLRAHVTSKGGTTEAALKVFQDRGVGDGIKEGIRRAFLRAGELSG